MKNYINIENSGFKPTQKIADFLLGIFKHNKNLKCFFTGSRAYGHPTPESDWDFVFLDRSIHSEKIEGGNSMITGMMDLFMKNDIVYNKCQLSNEIFWSISDIIKKIKEDDNDQEYSLDDPFCGKKSTYTCQVTETRKSAILEDKETRIARLEALLLHANADGVESTDKFNASTYEKCTGNKIHNTFQYRGTRTNVKVKYRGLLINLIGVDEYEFHMWRSITEHICAIKDHIKPGGHREVFINLRKSFKADYKYIYNESRSMVRNVVESL